MIVNTGCVSLYLFVFVFFGEYVNESCIRCVSNYANMMGSLTYVNAKRNFI